MDIALEELVKVGGWTDAPIPWPRKLKTGKPALIVTDDLARAIRAESEVAVAHHWGVCVVTVWKWRKSLGVGRMTEGTESLYRDYLPKKLPEWVAADGREKAATPENYRRMSDARRGVPADPATALALRVAASKRKSKSHRDAIGRAIAFYWLRRMPPIPAELIKAMIEYRKLAPDPSRGVAWSPCEEAILGLGPDRVVAMILRRTRASVSLHRQRLGVKSFRRSLDPATVYLDCSDAELAELFAIELTSE